MHFKSHFKNICAFLTPFTDIWIQETLNHYPNTLSFFPKTWIDTLVPLKAEQLWQIETEHNYNSIAGSDLGEFFAQIDELTALDGSDDPDDLNLPEWAFNRVGMKKRHEISRIGFQVEKLKPRFKHTVDIGGGQGHLARILAQYQGIRAYTIDQNAEFQELGKKRLYKYPRPEGANDLTFINMTFGSDEDKHTDVFNRDAFTIGLHTCGALANAHMKEAIDHETTGLFNFGCCYAKMDPARDTNLSEFAKENGLEMSEHALTLATRGYATMTPDEYDLKLRVKRMRYTLHLFLYHNMGLTDFIAMGEINPKHYWHAFSSYAMDRLAENNIAHEFSAETFDNYFDNPAVQEEVKQLYLCNLIRWKMGRLIEHYILTDRALYLEERGLSVTMKEYFNEKISPRNIGLLALRDE